MAELALGLTKTVVEGALSRIQWAIEEEGKLKEGVQQDLEFITGEFEMMQSFLKVANRERTRKNEVVMAWVRQLRNLAFDVENWVEFVAHLDKDKSQCSCWWRLVPSWVVPQRLMPPRDLDEAAAEMKLLKARVLDVSQRNTRYNLFNSDDPSFSSGSGLDSKAAVTPMTINLSSRSFEVLRQVWRHATDRLRQVKSLTNFITSQVSGKDLEVIWLLGVHGRHASDGHIIHMAYHDQEICKLFQRRAWVKITHPFNLQVFLNTLVSQLLFKGSSQEATNGRTSTELIQQLTMEQYLVVLEGVSDLVEWNTIKMYLPDNKKGSRIVVSTQNLQHAILCTEEQYQVSELEWFADDDRPSICAIYRGVAGQSNTNMDNLNEKIKRGGVISVYGHGPRKSSIVKKLFISATRNEKILDGVTFHCCRWIHVVKGVRFSVLDFSQRLLLTLHYYGFYDGDLNELFSIFHGDTFNNVLHVAKEEELIERCRKFLRECTNCLVVIDGLQSWKDWEDLEESKILLLDEPTSKCCVVVVTDNETVALHCCKEEDRLVHVTEVQAGMQLGPNFTTACRPPEHACGRQREDYLTWMRNMSRSCLAGRLLCYNTIIHRCMMSMTNNDSPPVVSVWGIAGVGKTTLVDWFFSHQLLNAEYQNFNYYCWVNVPDPFSLPELSMTLLEQFILEEDPRNKENVMIAIHQGDQNPTVECRRMLQQNPYGCLLVFDGLRSMDDWDTINVAFCLSQPIRGSRTIVITNERSVARHCVNKNDEQLVSVQGLEDGREALDLFKEKINLSINTDMEPADLEKELLESIMAKCGGLPKVIVDVAENYKQATAFYNRWNYSVLEHINDNFMQILDGSERLRSLFSWMQLYLETCNDDLKPCIFYLPVFPIGHDIRSNRLLWRLIAEGYIRNTSSNTAEESGARLLVELVEFSMFQEQKSSKQLKCRVNGFLHEYINSRPMEDNLVFALEGPCSLQSQRAGGQHLTIRRKWDRDMNVFESIDFSRLRSLTVFGECRPFMFDPAKIKMRYVRVLDLEDASGVTNGDLRHIMEVFPRLKFLSLRGCREITCLPESLGCLRQLQTLDVRHTSIARLPKAILKLQKLQYVRAGSIPTAPWDEGDIMEPYQAEAPADDSGRPHALLRPSSLLSKPCCRWGSLLDSNNNNNNNIMNRGVEVPAGIGKLTTLHIFGTASVVGPRNKAAIILKEVHKLTQLRRLGVCGINIHNIRDFFSAIAGLNHLSSLSAQLDKSMDGMFPCLDHTIASPPETMGSWLKLHGHVRVLPCSWIKKFANVSKLDLEVTLQEPQDMQVIVDQLIRRDLTTWFMFRLCIKPIYDGELRMEIIDDCGFVGLRLDVLEIVCTTNLRASIGEIQAVDVLRIHCSRGSSLKLSGLQAIGSLKEVWLKGSCSTALEQDLKRQLDLRQDKPVLKVLQPCSS